MFHLRGEGAHENENRATNGHESEIENLTVEVNPTCDIRSHLQENRMLKS
jgi:hypothetical protein